MSYSATILRMPKTRKRPPSVISVPIARNKIAQNSALARVLTESGFIALVPVRSCGGTIRSALPDHP